MTPATEWELLVGLVGAMCAKSASYACFEELHRELTSGAHAHPGMKLRALAVRCSRKNPGMLLLLPKVDALLASITDVPGGFPGRGELSEEDQAVLQRIPGLL